MGFFNHKEIQASRESVKLEHGNRVIGTEITGNGGISWVVMRETQYLYIVGKSGEGNEAQEGKTHSARKRRGKEALIGSDMGKDSSGKQFLGTWREKICGDRGD